MQKPYWEELVEATANMLFFIFALLIVILPPLVWAYQASEAESTAWKVGGTLAILLFAVFAKLLFELFADLLERIRRGEVLRWLFVPLRAFSGVLGIYGVLKLEYFYVHGMPKAGDTSWSEILWQFLTTL